MSALLRTRWTKQLEAAELDPSWKARLERRILRFMLARYDGSSAASPPGPFPLFWAESLPGRVRVGLTKRQRRYRLERVARLVRQSRAEHIFLLDWLFGLDDEFPEEAPPPSLEERVGETIEELEEFVAGQVEGERAARFQEGIYKKRSDVRW